MNHEGAPHDGVGAVEGQARGSRYHVRVVALDQHNARLDAYVRECVCMCVSESVCVFVCVRLFFIVCECKCVFLYLCVRL